MTGAETPGAAAIHAAAAAKAPFDRSKYETVTTADRLAAWIGEARAAGRVAFDTETTSIDPMQAELVGFSLAIAPGKAAYVPLSHRRAATELDFGGDVLPQVPLREALDLLKPLLEDPSILKIGQNLKYDFNVLAQHGIRIASFDDTMLMSYALDVGKGGHGMDDLAMRHLGHACISFDQVMAHAPGKKAERTFAQLPLDKATEYAAEDADVTLRLWMLLKARLVTERLVTVYETLERPLLPIIADMERTGIKVDAAILSRLSSTFAQGRCATGGGGEPPRRPQVQPRLAAPARRIAVRPTAASRRQAHQDRAVGDAGGSARRSRCQRGAARGRAPPHQHACSSGASSRSCARPTPTRCRASSIPRRAASTPPTRSAATTTGRLASSEPNLQNIPIRTEEGREIRTAFVAEKGKKLVSADYSQIELRVLAHIADIPQLRQAFEEGLDIHAMTASEMFGVPVEGMPAEVRRRAKAINFGIIYGISAFGLANQLGIAQRRGRGLHQDLLRALSRHPRLHGSGRRSARASTASSRRSSDGASITRRSTPRTRRARGYFERAAINAPIQGSAADIIRRAMIRMPTALAAAGLKSARMLLQVHDELVFEVAEAEVAKTLKTVTKVMEGAALPAVSLKVPIHVDAKAADNWEAAH